MEGIFRTRSGASSIAMAAHRRYRNNMKRGFSLLELLLVVAIILVLTSLYFGPSAGSRQRALQAACQKNLQKLYIAMQIYGTDFGGSFPKVAGARTSAEALEVLVPRYISDTSAFVG